MMTLPGPPEGGIELLFDTIREGWSIYKTKDGVLIKMRLIVLKLLLVDVKERIGAQIAAGSSLVFTVTAPKELKGPPDNQQRSHEEILAGIVEPNVPVETVREDWSEYDVEGIKVGLKTIATLISRSKYFDNVGDPIYNVNYQTIMKPIINPEEIAKFQKIWTERRPKKTA